MSARNPASVPPEHMQKFKEIMMTKEECTAFKPQPRPQSQRLAPEHFVLWSAGVLDIIGDRQPTPEEWTLLREQLRQSIAGVISSRLFNTPYVIPANHTSGYAKEATTSDRLV